MKIRILKYYYLIPIILLILELINIIIFSFLTFYKYSKRDSLLKIFILLNLLLFILFFIIYFKLIIQRIKEKEKFKDKIRRQKNQNIELFNENQLLNKKINILTKEHLLYETYNVAFINILNSIKKETETIKKSLFNKLIKDPNLILNFLNKINFYINRSISTLNLKIYLKDDKVEIIDYDVYLIKKEKLLFLIKNGKKFKFELSPTLFELLEFLIEKLIEDIKKDIPLEERGFIEKKIIEEKIFQGIEETNRFNSNNSRIRKMLKNSGLSPNFIENRDCYYRINTISEKVYLMKDLKDFNIYF